MKALLLNNHTGVSIRSVLAGSAQSILLHGPYGVGLATIAAEFDKSPSTTLWLRPEKEGVIDYEKGSITIAQIRELYETLRSVGGRGQDVIIDHAERMAEPAQNAFLKLLEEPPAGVRFILLAHDIDLLLPTIRSRVQAVEVRPISPSQSEDLLDTLNIIDPTKRAQLLFMASGLPAEITRLIKDDEYFTKRAAIVRDARQFISGTQYERLKVAHAYKDSRSKALQLVQDAIVQLRRSFEQTGDADLLERAKRLVEIYDTITRNGNVRLQLAAALVV